ncbi:hypothetical protein HDU79_004634 [Rhizoclosmatium sp. JEL0117]|nr:hypothetical protein HDU79_004634 [Rhizoclosmatium sp. JEL0117]
MGPRRPSATPSTASSTMTEVLKYRPKLFMIMAIFICVCAITVGVLGWQLTMAAGKQNVGSLIEEIEFLVSTQVSAFITNSAQTLGQITAVQDSMFTTDVWSFANQQRTQASFRAMLYELKGLKQFTTSMYMSTYPEGLQFGYSYKADENGTEQLRWWNQTGLTLYTYLCDEKTGVPYGSPLRVNYEPGNGTLENPGNNNTLATAVGGTQGADLEYAIGPTSGFSNIYAFEGAMYKSSYRFSINNETGEKVVFGNDWTLDFLSKQIRQILKVVSFPIFAAVIECETGHVLGTSSLQPLIINQTILSIQNINDPLFRDFANFANSTFSYGPIDSLPSQLTNVAVYENTYYPGEGIWFVDRKIGNTQWKLGINTGFLLGNNLLFVVYMNVDAVEEQLNRLGAQTGYMMIGIIGSFVLIGVLFSIFISRQLHIVVEQIKLLKDLKFRDVLGTDATVKNRSFIYELAELQKCFHSMVVVFSDLLKKNAMITGTTRASERTSGHAGVRPASVVTAPANDFLEGKKTDESSVRPAGAGLRTAL